MMTEGKKVGREKATAAAEAVNGATLFPLFAPREQHYPVDLPPVTPTAWRDKHLTQAQSDAIEKMKGFTDFNDLKVKSTLGIDGVKRQVKLAINKLLNRLPQQHTSTQEQNAKKSEAKIHAQAM